MSARPVWRLAQISQFCEYGVDGQMCVATPPHHLERISAGRWPASPRWCAAGFGVDYTLPGLDLLLHRAGWSVQVPARQAAERDEERSPSGGEEAWPVIKNGDGPGHLAGL